MDASQLEGTALDVDEAVKQKIEEFKAFMESHPDHSFIATARRKGSPVLFSASGNNQSDIVTVVALLDTAKVASPLQHWADIQKRALSIFSKEQQ